MFSRFCLSLSLPLAQFRGSIPIYTKLPFSTFSSSASASSSSPSSASSSSPSPLSSIESAAELGRKGISVTNSIESPQTLKGYITRDPIPWPTGKDHVASAYRWSPPHCEIPISDVKDLPIGSLPLEPIRIDTDGVRWWDFHENKTFKAWRRSPEHQMEVNIRGQRVVIPELEPTLDWVMSTPVDAHLFNESPIIFDSQSNDDDDVIPKAFNEKNYVICLQQEAQQSAVEEIRLRAELKEKEQKEEEENQRREREMEKETGKEAKH